MIFHLRLILFYDGVNLQLVVKQLGHDNTVTMQNTYVNLVEQVVLIGLSILKSSVDFFSIVHYN